MFNLRWRRAAPAAEQPPELEQQPAAPPAPPPDSLLGAQIAILGKEHGLTIVDAGTHNGHTTEQYLTYFPNCRVIGLEPASSNFEVSVERLASFGSSVEMVRAALSETDGSADLRLTSHSGSHSLLELGDDMRFFDEPISALPSERVRL